MTKKDVDKVFSELAKYKQIQKETEKIIEGLTDEVKSYMSKKNFEELVGTEHKATYKYVQQEKFDKAQFKKDHPRIAKRYISDGGYMRLNFS